MVWEVSQLCLKFAPTLLVLHQLVHCVVAILVHSIVVRIYQVALDVIDSLHLDFAELCGSRIGPHIRVRRPINELLSHIDGKNDQVFYEHQSQDEHGYSAEARPFNTIAV